jgi:hypothetical protein
MQWGHPKSTQLGGTQPRMFRLVAESCQTLMSTSGVDNVTHHRLHPKNQVGNSPGTQMPSWQMKSPARCRKHQKHTQIGRVAKRAESLCELVPNHEQYLSASHYCTLSPVFVIQTLYKRLCMDSLHVQCASPILDYAGNAGTLHEQHPQCLMRVNMDSTLVHLLHS